MNMEIQNEKNIKIILYKQNNVCIHTIKITNFLKQTLPHLYMLYIEFGTAVKKL